MPQSPLFEGLSLEQPSLLTITFPRKNGYGGGGAVSLGATLANHDNGLTNEMMAPGFASIGALLDEDGDYNNSHDDNNTTSSCNSGSGDSSGGEAPQQQYHHQSLARKYGVKVGDYIVGINGIGYRRFPPDFPYETLEDVTLLPPPPPQQQQNDGNNKVDLLIQLNDKNEVEDKDGAAHDVHKNDDKDRPDIIVKDVDNTNTTKESSSQPTTVNYQLLYRVLSGKSGTLYPQLLSKIKQIKLAASSSSSASSSENHPPPPLILHLERYTWDSRVHSWSRFLSARNGHVPSAMTAMQQHEMWRSTFFPIDLTSPSLQKVLKVQAVSEIDVVSSSSSSTCGSDIAPVVYIDFAKLQSMVNTTTNTNNSASTTTSPFLAAASENNINNNNNNIDSTDVVIQAFVIYTETLLNKSPDPRSPKLCQFIDLTGVTIHAGILQPGILKKLYSTFEPNYPETLQKMVLYPVPRWMVRIVDAMLSFVNEHTRKKFIITDDLGLVCKELGWNWKEITEELDGSVNRYMKKHSLRHGLSFVLD